MRLPNRSRLVWQRLLYVLANPVRSLRFRQASKNLYASCPALWYSDGVAKSLGRPQPRHDWMLSGRVPSFQKLVDKHTGQIKIDEMYFSGNEIREDSRPYQDFADIISGAGILQGMTSILDIGCATGHLLKFLNDQHPDITVAGIEYFEYQKQAAHESVRDAISILDVRLPFPETLNCDLVICTEVGEHVEPAALDSLIANLASSTNKRLLLTWSEDYGPPSAPPQHLSPLSTGDVSILMQDAGFRFNSELTRQVAAGLETSSYAYSWWLDSLGVWEKR